MSRTRRPLDVQKQAELVLARLEEEPAGWRRERLQAVRLGLKGEQDLQEIARAVGRARSVIQEWFNLYRTGGLASLLQVRRGRGPKSRLTEAQAAFLRAGLREGRWRTAAQAQQALAKKGLRVTLTSIYRYLGKLAARLRVPRPSHLKKDPAAAEAFKTTLAAQLTALALEPTRPVRLWVMDEMRCGLHPETRRVWGLPGHRPVVKAQQKYRWQYVYGALEIGGGAAEFWYAPTVNLECNRHFLQQLAAQDPARTHVIIYDGAGFHHRDGHAALPANVRILTLPAYSPELNPVEKLWDLLRDAICNRVFPTIPKLCEAITARLRPFWEEPEPVLSLLGTGWLLAQANASGPSIIPE